MLFKIPGHSKGTLLLLVHLSPCIRMRLMNLSLETLVLNVHDNLTLVYCVFLGAYRNWLSPPTASSFVFNCKWYLKVVDSAILVSYSGFWGSFPCVLSNSRSLFACVHESQMRHKQEFATKKVKIYLGNWHQTQKHSWASSPRLDSLMACRFQIIKVQS